MIPNRLWLVTLNAALLVSFSAAYPQQPSGRKADAIFVDGTVRNSSGEAIPDASVFLTEKSRSISLTAKTKAGGKFTFLVLRAGTYSIRAQKAGFREISIDSFVLAPREAKHFDLVLESLPTRSSTPEQEVQFVAQLKNQSQPHRPISLSLLRSQQSRFLLE